MNGKICSCAVMLMTIAAAVPAAGTHSLEAALPAGVDQAVTRADTIAWGPCPPGPLAGEGCGMAVLEGNPGADVWAANRLKAPPPPRS